MAVSVFKCSLYFRGFSLTALYAFYIELVLLILYSRWAKDWREWILSVAISSYFYLQFITLLDSSSLYSRLFFAMDPNPYKRYYQDQNIKMYLICVSAYIIIPLVAYKRYEFHCLLQEFGDRESKKILRRQQGRRTDLNSRYSGGLISVGSGENGLLSSKGSGGKDGVWRDFERGVEVKGTKSNVIQVSEMKRRGRAAKSNLDKEFLQKDPKLANLIEEECEEG